MQWEILNTGDLAWSPEYTLHFKKGYNASLYTISQPLGRWVQPGEFITISIPSHVPTEVGDYEQIWNLANANGVDFYSVYFNFTVRIPTTATKTAIPPTAVPPTAVPPTSVPATSVPPVFYTQPPVYHFPTATPV